MDLLPNNLRQNYLIYKNELGRPRRFFYNLPPNIIYGKPTDNSEIQIHASDIMVDPDN